MKTDGRKGALPVQSWDVDQITPYEKNAKKHSAEQVKLLAENIKRLGLNNPLSVDRNGMIIAGHGRFLAIKLLGWKKVPVVVRDDLSDQEVIAMRLADNKTASTDWDTELLKDDIKGLEGSDIELTDLGFNDKEITFLTDDADVLDEDVLAEDVTGAVEERKAESEKTVEEIAASEVSLTKVLGFSKVPAKAEPMIVEWLALLEHQTGKKEAEAFVAWLASRDER